MVQQTVFNYRVKRIKDYSFVVNESLFLNDPTKMIKVELSQVFGVNFDLNLANLKMRVYLHYEDSPQNILVDLYVENVFEITDLKKGLEGTELKLPPDLIVSLVSMSVSHSRALLAKNLAGTVYQDAIMPIANPLELAAHFFPGVFDNVPKTHKSAK